MYRYVQMRTDTYSYVVYVCRNPRTWVLSSVYYYCYALPCYAHTRTVPCIHEEKSVAVIVSCIGHVPIVQFVVVVRDWSGSRGSRALPPCSHPPLPLIPSPIISVMGRYKGFTAPAATPVQTAQRFKVVRALIK